jgi:O-antigen/teichoic acid export membrane protein
MIQKTVQTIRKNAIYLLSAESLIRIGMLVFTVIIGRSYSTEKFGVYTLALSVGGLFDVLTSFGLGTLFMQQNAEEKDKNKLAENFAKFITLKCLLTVLLIILTVGFSLLMNKSPDTLTALIIGAVYIGVNSLTSFLWTIFDFKQKMQYTAAMKLVFYAVLLAFGLYFTLNQYPIYWAIGAYLIGSTVALLVTIITIRTGNFAKFRFKVDWTLWKKLLIEGWPITISGAFVFTYNYLDTIIISFTKSEEMVGLYQVSYKIIGSLFILAQLINQSYFPALIAQKKAKQEMLEQIFNSNIKTILFWSIPMTAGGTVLASNIIFTIFGPNYMAGVPAFKILIWNCILYFLGTSISTLIYALGKQKNIVKAFMWGAIANTALNIVIIPYFGIEGAAMTTVLAEFIVLTTMFLEVRKITTVKIQILKNAIIPTISSLIMVGGLLLLQKVDNSLFILVPFGAALYFLSTAILRKIETNNTTIQA